MNSRNIESSTIMNTITLDIMKFLNKTPFETQRRLSENTGYSIGKINQSLAELQTAGYLDQSSALTEAGKGFIKRNSPDNAIILAAGFGMRMVPINREYPKGLLEAQGEIFIERQIRQLHEAGVYDITVIVGFMKESYEYLIDKFGVDLVVNTQYAEKNNLHSLNLVNGKLGNTYIIPCDIWAETNPFSDTELYSWYMVTDLIDSESYVRVNRKQELVTVDPEVSGNEMIGISYITEEDASWLRTKLSQMDSKKRYSSAFWEETLMDRDRMLIHAKLVPSSRVCEINTYEELRELDESSRNLRSEVISIISKTLNVKESEVTDIELLKKGMTNRSFFFSAEGGRYIMRVPGEGTDRLINRREEHAVYEAIENIHLSDDVLYFDPDNGYKITRFIPDAHCCDPDNWEEIGKCMEVLRRFHGEGLSVDHSFDIFGKTDFYETLWEGEPSCYRDYEETKKKVYSLRNMIDSSEKEWTLCHIDSVPDNFMINSEGIRLIDWEYAGMQDPDVDIAMFAIYALFDKTQTDRLIDTYYREGCTSERRRKIYCYVASCGLLWSNWCEFKRHQGVEFGEYALKQYRYAKDFYRYALDI